MTTFSRQTHNTSYIAYEARPSKPVSVKVGDQMEAVQVHPEVYVREFTSIKVAKINIDEQPQLAAQYGVMSIPTLIVFENGDVADKAVGARNKSFILQMLEG